MLECSPPYANTRRVQSVRVLRRQKKVHRLVELVRKKPERRTTVKVRTLLSAFGYSRRSQECVQAICQQLAAEGLTVHLSVNSPATLDDWIELREKMADSSQSIASATAIEKGKSREKKASDSASTAQQSAASRTVSPSEAETGDTAEGFKANPIDLPPTPSAVVQADARHALADVKNDHAFVSSGLTDSIAQAKADPPRSFAARLFRAAVSLFEDAPPTTLGLTEGPDARVPDSPVAVPRSPRQSSASKRSSSIDSRSPTPAADTAKAVPVTPTARPAAGAPSTPELSFVAEQTIQSTVFVQVEQGYGSGFIVHHDGLVITACHVLDGPSGIAKTAIIRTHDGRESTASLLRAHRSLDFALLWMDKADHYPSLEVGEASRTRYAETVLAVGHPGTRSGRALRNTVSTGVVANPACTERGIEWIQMTTDIDPGNSGGPLVNRNGEVIGINCWGFLDVAAAKMALPIDYLREELSLATKRGRSGTASGRVCSICGWFDSEPADWFCPTCGVTHAIQADDATKGRMSGKTKG